MRIIISVIDTVRGRPAAGVPARLDLYDGEGWRPGGEGVTGADGRVVLDVEGEAAGPARARLGAGQYFTTAFPELQVIFDPEAGSRIDVQMAPHFYSATVVTG